MPRTLLATYIVLGVCTAVSVGALLVLGFSNSFSFLLTGSFIAAAPYILLAGTATVFRKQLPERIAILAGAISLPVLSAPFLLRGGGCAWPMYFIGLQLGVCTIATIITFLTFLIGLLVSNKNSTPRSLPAAYLLVAAYAAISTAILLIFFLPHEGLLFTLMGAAIAISPYGLLVIITPSFRKNLSVGVAILLGVIAILITPLFLYAVLRDLIPVYLCVVCSIAGVIAIIPPLNRAISHVLRSSPE